MLRYLLVSIILLTFVLNNNFNNGKKLIRVGVWETNSSSSHSLSLGSSQSKDFVLDTIYPDEEGKIYINGGEFGWEWNKFNDSMTKANYAAQQLENSDMDNFIEVIKEGYRC